MVKQVGLLTAGCQPWNTDMCAASGDRFAYCATLAIYVYQLDRKYNEFRLLSVMSEHKKTITAIAWHPHDLDWFASSSAENKIIIWDIIKQTSVAVYENTKAMPVTIGWSHFHGTDNLSFIAGRGPLFVWTPNGVSLTLSTIKETVGFSSNVTCFKWHPKKLEKVAFGHMDGSISVCTIGSKCIKHTLRPESEDSDDEGDDPVVTLQWDPLSIDYLLIANASSGARLVDSVSLSVIMVFQLPSAAAKICTLSWLSTAPGMFVTGDSHSGILRVWNVSRSTPVENIKVKKTGFHSLLAICDTIPNKSQAFNDSNSDLSNVISSTSVAQPPAMTTLTHFALPPAHIICTFMDGGVGVYDLGRRRWNFLRDQGHIETIFDCRFHPNNCDILATASFDGSIKLWDINTLTCVNGSPGNEGVIYSISWAPADLNCIVAGTSKQGMFIWDVKKGRIIKRFQEHGRHSVFNVSWNQKDSRRILSCGADGYCIIRQVDGELIQKYKHPSAVYGGDWSPHNKDMFATGCEDKNIRVYYLTTSNDQPLKVFTGHTDKVFHVKWSPLKEGLLCSGSDDGSIRVWDYSQEACISILTGHKGPVRGLIWNTEVPYLVLSGSWDSHIKIWDIRVGTCLDTVSDHGADVYGLACHPSRPFILASSSRDSTLRLWSLTSLIQPIELNILAGKSWTEILGTTEAAMTVGAMPLLTGRESKELRSQAEQYPTDVRGRVLKYFSKFFMVPSGTNNLWELVSVVQGLDDTLLSQNYSKGIMHVKHLTKFYASDAQQLEMAKMTKHGGGIGAPTKEERIKEAANIHIKTGNIQRYCELMVELGKWERALAVAPGVSMDYWKDLAHRYSRYLMLEDSDLAVPFCTAVGDSHGLAKFFMSRGQMLDAVVTAQVACEGTCGPKQTVHPDSRQWNGSTEHLENNLILLKHTVSELAESYFRKGCPVLAACCHLAVDDTKKAMSRLVQGHELELAVAMGKTLVNLEEHTAVAIEMLSRRCEHLGKWDLAVDLLLDITNNELLLAKCCSRCSLNIQEIDALHQRAGFPSLDGCQHEAEKLRTMINCFECVKYYLLSKTPEAGLEIGLKYVKDKLTSSSWKCDDVFPMLQLLGCVCTSTLQQHSEKNELLALSAYIGGLVAIRREYNPIVPALFNTARLMLQKCDLSDIGLSDSQIHKECKAWVVAHTGQPTGSKDLNILPAEYKPVYQELIQKAGVETSEVLKGAVCVDGSHLPSHSDVHVSCLTGERVQGRAVFLEDGHSAVSSNEALMWARVNPFSPSGTGCRINPF